MNSILQCNNNAFILSSTNKTVILILYTNWKNYLQCQDYSSSWYWHRLNADMSSKLIHIYTYSMYLTVQVYCKCQTLVMEKFGKFDERLVICQNFSYKPLLTSSNVSPMKSTINFSFISLKLCVCSFYQIASSSNFSAMKVAS